MANFPPDFLDDLRAKVDLASVVGRRVKLVRRGREYVGLSPFQKEKTPSFTVVPEKGFYHCFSSGEHGDVIDFVMKTDGLSFPEAVEKLAGEAGLSVPADSPEEHERARRRQSLHEVLEAACRHFERALHMPEGRGALDYLKGRGLADETIKGFRLGFAADSRGGLKAALAREGIDEALAREAGLIRRPDDGRPDYDYFRRRVIFPITDRRGRVVAFGGRILGEGEPKYLNSPESPVFAKRHVLYGLGQALAGARAAGTALVVEGYMDVIALHQAGFDYAVAPLGTALTEEQLATLWRMVRDPILCFDGDRAGQKAAGRVAERALPLLKPGYALRFALLPAGEDPDSLIRRDGPAAMEGVLKAAQPLSEVLWRLETEGKPLATPEDRAALEDRLRRQAVRIEDASVRAHFLRAFKDRSWEAFRQAGPARRAPEGKRSRGPQARYVRTAPGGAVDAVNRAQRVLLAAVLNHPAIFDRVGDRLGGIGFADPELDVLRQEIVGAMTENPDLDAAALRVALVARGQQARIEALFRDPLVAGHRKIGPDSPFDDVEATWEDSLAVLGRLERVRERARLRDRLLAEAAETDEAAWQRQQAAIRAALDEDDAAGGGV